MRIDIRSCSDWEALYIDGILYEEGHSLQWPRILQQLSDRLYITVTDEEIEVPPDFSDDTHYIHFEDRLEDISVGRYDDGE